MKIEDTENVEKMTVDKIPVRLSKYKQFFLMFIQML